MPRTDTQTRRDIVDKLLRIKARRGRETHLVSAHTYELDHIVSKAGDDHDVVLKLIPIRAVTFIEVLTRAAMADLIDAGNPYLDRAEKLFKKIDYRADFKTIAALRGQSITIGDILAHMVKVNKLDDIHWNMSSLLDSDYFASLSTVYDRFNVEIRGKEPVPTLGEKTIWYPILERMFNARHIIVHEMSSYDMLSLEEAKTYADTATRFLNASWQVIANTLEPNYPLTQTEMNISAQEKFNDVEVELDALVLRLENRIEDDPRSLEVFKDMHKKWQEFREAQMLFRHDPQGGGTIGPMLRALEGHELTRTRIAYYEKWLNREEGDL